MKRVCVMHVAVMVFALSAVAIAAVPTQINLQGILRDAIGNPVTDGPYSVVFKIYDAPASGTVYWTETKSVTTTGGLFATLLGSITPIPDSAFDGDSRYLGIKVGTDAEMTPRQKLASVAFSNRVGSVDGASGGNIFGDLVVGDESDTLLSSSAANATDCAIQSTGGWARISNKANIGPNHINSGDFTLVVGCRNTIFGSADFSTITGGSHNFAVGLATVISGGIDNMAFGNFSVVSGGEFDTIYSNHANIGGGLDNMITGPASFGTIAGGSGNTVSGLAGTIGGGSFNLASNSGSTVGGGSFDTASGIVATIAGGRMNVASGDSSAVGGGQRNRALSPGTTVSGGCNNVALGSFSTVGGGQNDSANSVGATVGGGRRNTAVGQDAVVGGGADNRAASGGATVGGGTLDTASGGGSTVGGGTFNVASNTGSTVSGGQFNRASGLRATVSGGNSNTASAQNTVVGGGLFNAATGLFATVPGGRSDTAGGDYSFAAGRQAQANHAGAFVWADQGGGGTNFASTAADQFSVRASGGTRIFSNNLLTAGVTLAAGASAWAVASDSTLKRNIRAVDGREILSKVSQLPIKRWSYKSQDASIEHIGPMAQDFYALFRVGDDEKTISTIDPAGVALAAIQELNRKVAEIDGLRAELRDLKKLVETLTAERLQTGDATMAAHGEGARK